LPLLELFATNFTSHLQCKCMKLVINFSLILCLLINPAIAAETSSHKLNHELKTSLKTFENINVRDQHCTEKQKSCSPVLKELVEVDGKAKFFGLIKHENEVCEKYIQNDKNSRYFKSAHDLSHQLAQYQAKGSVSADSIAIEHCLAEDAIQSKNAVSKYFYYVSRLQHGQFRDLEEIADIDQILNSDYVYKDFICAAMPFENNRRRCEELKRSCVVGGLDNFVNETAQDLKHINIMKNEMKEIRSKMLKQNAANQKIDDPKKQMATYNAYKLMIDLITNRNPVLKGEIFQKEKDKNLKEAIRSQLQANRKAMISHVASTNDMHKCLMGTLSSEKCNPDNVREFIETQTPDLTIPEFDIASGKTREESLLGWNYLNYQKCLHEGKVSQLKDDEVISSAAFYTGLSLATVLTGGVAGAVAASGTRVGAVASTAARGYELARRVNAVSSVRKMQILKAAKVLTLGADGAAFGGSVNEAASACSKEVEGLEGDENSSRKTCEGGASLSTRNVVKKYDECVMKVVFAGLSAVPLGLGVAQKAMQKATQKEVMSKTDKLLHKYGGTREDLALEKTALKNGEQSTARANIVTANASLDDAARAQKIKADFPNLKAKQIACVVTQAHPVGRGNWNGKGVYQYDKKDIVKKARTLRRDCKIGVDDMRALLQLGYAGDLPPALSDFAKLLNMGASAEARLAVQSVDEMKGTLSELTENLAKATDPLKRVQLRDEIHALEQKIVQETLAQNPQAIDDILAGSSKLPDSRMLNTETIKLSPKKLEALEKAKVDPMEQMLIEIKPGDTVYFKSESFENGMAKIRGVDPDHPENIIVDIISPDSDKVRTVSMFQTDIAMTDAEKAEALMLVMKETNKGMAKEGKKTFQDLLQQKPGVDGLIDRLASAMAKEAGRSETKIKADNLLIKILEMEKNKGQGAVANLTDPEYVSAVKKYYEITRMTPQESKVIRAIHEIDLSRPATAEELRVLNEAKRIRDLKSETDLPLHVREAFKEIKKIEDQVASAPARFRSRKAIELQRLNGSASFGRRYDFPSLSSFEKTFAQNNSTLTATEKQNYKAMEKLFTEDPQLVSDESRKWLRDSAPEFLRKSAKASSDDKETRDYFLKRLQIYIDIQRTPF
jgi:transcription antitermination factor NusG